MEIFLICLVVAIAAGAAGFWVGRRPTAYAVAERDRAIAQAHAMEIEATRAQERLLSERHAVQARLEQLAADRAALSREFESLAARALTDNNQRFLEVADQRLRRSTEAHVGELAKREEAVAHLVEPLTRTLTEVRDEVGASEKARAEAQAALAAQVELMRTSSDSLRRETAQLVSALRAPQVRGRWGEMQLRRVVESAGMVDRVDFVEQETHTAEDRSIRPDLIVKLTDGRSIIVDAKVPFEGYLRASEATTEAEHKEGLAAHARALRAHVEALSRKKYWEHVGLTPEFVVLFVPADVFLDAALREDPTILEYGFERDIVIATPTTLVALLRTVAYTWRQEALAESAAQVHRVGKELHGRLATMGSHLAMLGKRLDGAVDAYNKSISSIESRVLVSARKLATLEVLPDDLSAGEQIERQTRLVQAPELVASVTESIVHLEDSALDSMVSSDLMQDSALFDEEGESSSIA